MVHNFIPLSLSWPYPAS